MGQIDRNRSISMLHARNAVCISLAGRAFQSIMIMLALAGLTMILRARR
jgi:hypothetical protein